MPSSQTLEATWDCSLDKASLAFISFLWSGSNRVLLNKKPLKPIYIWKFIMYLFTYLGSLEHCALSFLPRCPGCWRSGPSFQCHRVRLWPWSCSGADGNGDLKIDKKYDFSFICQTTFHRIHFTYRYGLVLVGEVPLQLVPWVPVHPKLVVDLLQGLPHLVLAGFDGVHFSHQVVLRVVVHQVDPFPKLRSNLW